jgi:hypothetical protein
MTVADQIEALMTHRPGLTEAELAAALFGDAGSPQRISNACRGLMRSRRIERSGRGGRSDPFRYYLIGLVDAPAVRSMRRRYHPF